MTETQTPPSEPEEARDSHVAGHDHIPGEGMPDPENDVDGLKTAGAVFGTLILIVGTIWVMSHVFTLMVSVERKAKIHEVAPKALQEIRGAAETELAGKNPKRGAKSITQAITEYTGK